MIRLRPRGRPEAALLTPLVEAVRPSGAPAPAPALRPLAAVDRNALSAAFDAGDLAAAEPVLARRLPGVSLAVASLGPLDTAAPLRIAPGRVELGVEPGLKGSAQWYKYHRLGDVLPFLSYVAQKVTRSGRLSLDLGDAGAPGALGFSCTTASHLIPDCVFLASAGYAAERAAAPAAPAWSARDGRVLWRGATTGLTDGDWRTLPRAQLCRLAREARDELPYDVGFTSVVQAGSEAEAAQIEASGLIRDFVPSTRFGDYRHHIDIDGNTNSWGGLFLKLLCGGLVFKVASPGGHRQWYYPRLQPWLHYVPVDSTLRDLHEAVRWARAHEARAAEIAAAGQRLALSMTLEAEAGFGLAVVEEALAKASPDAARREELRP